jgi:NADPH-dependent curcumin reductase CurA
VLGIAGTDEKCQWLIKDLGFDGALNYKDKDFGKKFRDATKVKSSNLQFMAPALR